MKPEQMYHELKILAEKLGLQVSEQNFRPTGIRVRSGYCKVKGKYWCIIDKHLRLPKKVEALAECISEMPHESVYVVPAVREFLHQFGGHEQGRSIEANPEEPDGKSPDEKFT